MGGLEGNTAVMIEGEASNAVIPTIHETSFHCLVIFMALID